MTNSANLANGARKMAIVSQAHARALVSAAVHFRDGSFIESARRSIEFARSEREYAVKFGWKLP